MPVLCIGIGNEFRHDDAAGLMTVRALARLKLPDINILEHSGEGASLMQTWQQAGRVILIDAVSSGQPPGTIARFLAHKQSIPAQFFAYSSHAFGVVEAIELARSLEQLPAQLIVYGIEGQNFKMGTGLNPAVEQAISAVTEKIQQDIHNL